MAASSTAVDLRTLATKMRRIRIPPEITKALAPLAKLNPALVRRLSDELGEKLEVRLLVESDVEKLVQSSAVLADVKEEDRSLLTDSLTGLHYLKSASGYGVDELIDVVSKAFGREGDSADGSRERLEENLRTILSIKPLIASAKALDLLSERDKVLLGTRILSNIRPVFDDDLTAPFLASVVTHSLKITVRGASSGAETIYLSLDTQDLKDLRDTIDRAILKANSIASKLNEPGVGNFGKLIEVEDERP
jgi:hypothetical protein